MTKLLGSSLLLAALATFPLLSQDNDPDRAVKGNGKFPAGWSARPDRGSADALVFTEAGGVFHFTMGSAGTFYNPAWTKSGDYKYSARLTQTKAPTHPISYGLVIGGTNMGAPNQSYTYFLVRNQGDYFISNWEGARPATVVDWTANAAVAKQAAGGKQTNTLGVQTQGDNVIFTVNGTEVTRLPKSKVHAAGLIGFRIGHNLDVDVDQVVR